MTIQNKTQNTIIAQKAREAKTFREQTFGLLEHKEPIALLLRTRFGIHTFFMEYPIDIVILDQTHHVAAIKHRMRPNTIFLWNLKHNIVLELPVGTVEKTKTQVMDQIVMIE